MIDSGLVGREIGEVPRGEKMLYYATDPESYISEYTFSIRILFCLKLNVPKLSFILPKVECA